MKQDPRIVMEAKILIIDDDQGIGYMLSRICQRNGWQTKQVFELSKGLEQASSNAYDLILLDIYLPDGNGLQSIEQFLKLPNAPEVVIITGYGDPDGKECIARAIHNNSPWSGGKFAVVDCASLKGSLAESTLFGHVKGAYTGADVSKSGLISMAHNGTLFLDEIGELPMDLQKLFLRVLQERRFRPVGSTREMSSQFKLLAATNRDLKKMVDQGSFREDLYYRIKSIVIPVPPLREHTEDLQGLVQYYVTQICEREHISVKGISNEVLSLFHDYDWPGNIRELIQVLESAAALAGPEPMIHPEHLPVELRTLGIKTIATESRGVDSSVHPALGQDGLLPDWKSYRTGVVAEAERTYLQVLMERRSS